MTRLIKKKPSRWTAAGVSFSSQPIREISDTLMFVSVTGHRQLLSLTLHVFQLRTFALKTDWFGCTYIMLPCWFDRTSVHILSSFCPSHLIEPARVLPNLGT